MGGNTYTTLLDICAEKGIGRRPADIAHYLNKKGYPITASTIGNWKSRGVPSQAVLRLVDILGVPSYRLTDPDWQPATTANPFPAVPNPTNGCPPLTLEDVIDYFVTLTQGERDKLMFALNAIYRSNLTVR